MARTSINSLGIPDGTIVSADLSYPLTDFSSTGIDDNATSNALTIDSSGNISVTGYIAGPSTFTIDPAAVGDNTGTLVVAGNLQVDGTTTTINSTTMTVDDLNITLASGAANAAAANGAGITVDGASATLTYNSTPDAWSFNKNVGIGTSSPSTGLELSGAGNTSRIKLINGSDQINFGLWDNSNYRLEGDANRKILITSYHTDGIHLGGSGSSDLVVKGGNVGIGTTSPGDYNSIMDDLVISRAGDSGITIVSGTTSEGSIAFADGTSGADTYRGWINYNHNSNFLRFATNATVRMYIDSAGKIGIGNQNPSGSFHLNTVDASGSDVYYVAQNTTASRIAGYRILDESNNIGGVFQYDNGGNNLLIGTTLASNFQFITNNTERMRINTDGSIAFSPNAGTVGQAALSINASGSSYAELDAFMWGIGWNMPLVLQRQAGNVGIGTISPSEKLHVSGNIRAGVSVTSFQNGSANDNYIGVGSDNGGDAWFIAHASGYGVALMGYESAGDRLLIGCDNGAGNNKIDFSLNMGTNAAGTVENTSGATPAVRINASGNLLVGTTNASGSLSNTANTTSGSFKTQSGSVTQTGGSGWYSAFTIPNSQTGLYLLHVYVNGYVAGPSDWSNAFVISHTGAGNTAYLWNLSGANTGNIQARITSVANVEFYLIGGTNINYGYSLTRLH